MLVSAKGGTRPIGHDVANIGIEALRGEKLEHAEHLERTNTTRQILVRTKDGPPTSARSPRS